jgi:hypothetical protein
MDMEFDYSKATLDDLDEKAMQLLVFDTKELTSILNGHLFIEPILDALIDRNLKHPEHLRRNQRLTLDLKIDLAQAVGVLTERFVSPIKALNSIRNKYAHSENYQVSIEGLNRLKLKWQPKQEAFKVASAKGIEDATLIATLFLTRACMRLLDQPAT